MIPRKKSSWRFLVPLFAGLIFLSLLSVRARRSPLYEQWVLGALSPVTDLFRWTADGIRGTWNHYFYLAGVSRELPVLREEVELLKRQLAENRELIQENDRLKELLDLKQKTFPKSVAARVTAFDPRSEFKSVRIDKGSDHGIRPDMPVTAAAGLVGKVGPVFKKEALVLLIADPASFADVLVSRSRVRGLLAGNAGLLTRVEFLKKESDVQEGDAVVTSGLDQLYPKGILVGEIQGIEKDPLGVFQSAKVAPAVDFGRLEEVLVLEPAKP